MVTPIYVLRRKIILEVLARLQPLLLLRILAALSRTAVTGVSQAQGLARSLLLDGRQRLLGIIAAAPRLHLPVDRLRELCQSDQATDALEQVAHALFELCLGLLLQWLHSRLRRRRHGPVCKLLKSSCIYLPSDYLSGIPRIRACPGLHCA